MAKIKVIELESTTSTNDFLKDNYLDFPHFTLVRADVQTKGRGQFDRIWEAHKSKNLLVSLLLKDISFHQIDEIKKCIIQSMIFLLEKYQIRPRFKEPNDFYVGDEKLCGILIETKLTGNSIDYCIVGIGLNVNQMTFSKKTQATSLKKLTHKHHHVRRLFRHFIQFLLQTYETQVNKIHEY